MLTVRQLLGMKKAEVFAVGVDAARDVLCFCRQFLPDFLDRGFRFRDFVSKGGDCFAAG